MAEEEFKPISGRGSVKLDDNHAEVFKPVNRGTVEVQHRPSGKIYAVEYKSAGSDITIELGEQNKDLNRFHQMAIISQALKALGGQFLNDKSITLDVPTENIKVLIDNPELTSIQTGIETNYGDLEVKHDFGFVNGAFRYASTLMSNSMDTEEAKQFTKGAVALIGGQLIEQTVAQRLSRE